jgi:hypothetical protein
MLTRAQIDQYIKDIPAGINAEERRAAYATITGFSEDKGVKEICTYYTLSAEVVEHWMNFFNFSSTKGKTSGKRSSKSAAIEKFLAENPGKQVNFAELAGQLNVSVPTIYNFYNTNRLYFRKVGRGNFEILDPKVERAK